MYMLGCLNSIHVMLFFNFSLLIDFFTWFVSPYALLYLLLMFSIYVIYAYSIIYIVL